MKQIISARSEEARIINDAWTLNRDPDAESVQAGEIIAFACWKRLRALGMLPDTAGYAVWLAPEDAFSSEIEALLHLPLIAVDFPSFRDGRGYSVAYLLRQRHDYRGELRAIGDVLRDQLFFMQRCGFDSFDIKAGKDIQDALKGLSSYSVKYQGAVDDPVPLFRKRGDALAELDDWEP